MSMATLSSVQMAAGTNYTIRFAFKGTAGQNYRVYLEQTGNESVSFFLDPYQIITASGGTDVLQFTGTCPSGVTQATFVLSTDTQRVDTFYVDDIICMRGDYVPSGNADLSSGYVLDNLRQLIVKTAPVSITTTNIPPDDITIIGHYRGSATGYETGDNIANECFMQIMEYIRPYKVEL